MKGQGALEPHGLTTGDFFGSTRHLFVKVFETEGLKTHVLLNNMKYFYFF